MREPAFTAAPRLVAFGPDQGLPEAVQALVSAAAREAFDRAARALTAPDGTVNANIRVVTLITERPNEQPRKPPPNQRQT